MLKTIGIRAVLIRERLQMFPSRSKDLYIVCYYCCVKSRAIFLKLYFLRVRRETLCVSTVMANLKEFIYCVFNAQHNKRDERSVLLGG
jgi:hypothetical protein